MDAHMEESLKLYKDRGFGSRSGFGEHPALLVVDMTNGFTDPASPMGCDLSSQIEAIQSLLREFRVQGRPVFYTTNLYDPDDPGGQLFATKIPALKVLEPGSKAVEVDDRIKPQPGEPVLEKRVPSPFVGTDFEERLKRLGVDTVLITGVSASACVRASGIDAMSRGYRAVIVRDGVGDRAPGRCESNLFDFDAKFGDVLSLKDALGYLESLGPIG